MRAALRTTLLLCGAMVAACADRTADPPAQDAVDAPTSHDDSAVLGSRDSAPTGTPSSPSSTPAVPTGRGLTLDDAVQITTVLTEWSIRLSTDTVQTGAYAFILQNRTIRPHTVELRGDNGMRWRSLPVPPGASSRLALRLGPGTYTVMSGDTTYARRGMRAALVVTER